MISTSAPVAAAAARIASSAERGAAGRAWARSAAVRRGARPPTGVDDRRRAIHLDPNGFADQALDLVHRIGVRMRAGRWFAETGGRRHAEGVAFDRDGARRVDRPQIDRRRGRRDGPARRARAASDAGAEGDAGAAGRGWRRRELCGRRRGRCLTLRGAAASAAPGVGAAAGLSSSAAMSAAIGSGSACEIGAARERRGSGSAAWRGRRRPSARTAGRAAQEAATESDGTGACEFAAAPGGGMSMPGMRTTGAAGRGSRLRARRHRGCAAGCRNPGCESESERTAVAGLAAVARVSAQAWRWSPSASRVRRSGRLKCPAGLTSAAVSLPRGQRPYTVETIAVPSPICPQAPWAQSHTNVPEL